MKPLLVPLASRSGVDACMVERLHTACLKLWDETSSRGIYVVQLVVMSPAIAYWTRPVVHVLGLGALRIVSGRFFT